MDCCVSESRIPSNGQPLDGVTIGFFACGREEKRPSSCHLTDRHIRACQSGHFLKTASLHPPPAALQRFSRWRQNQLFALVAPAVRRTHSYPPNTVLLIFINFSIWLLRISRIIIFKSDIVSVFIDVSDPRRYISVFIGHSISN